MSGPPMTASLAPIFHIAEPERAARLRELRMAARLLLGPLALLANAETALAALDRDDTLIGSPADG